MTDIFLSYASADRERIRPLVSVLEQQGWSVWWDRKIPPGKTYDQVIEQALEGARCIVVVWSQTSVQSEWVKVEADEGMNRNALVPVLIEEAKIPLAFRRIQAARLIDWKGDSSHPELTMLFESIKAITGEAQPKEESIREEGRVQSTISEAPFQRSPDQYPPQSAINEPQIPAFLRLPPVDLLKHKGPKRNLNPWLAAGGAVALIGLVIAAIWGAGSGGNNALATPTPVVGGSTESRKDRLAKTADWRGFVIRYFGKPIEASGVAYPPGATGVVIAADNHPGEILWMPLDEEGKQAGSLQTIPLGVSFTDPEAVTYGASFFYLVTSQSNPNDGQKNAIVRFDINPETRALRGQPEIITDLRSFLLKGMPAIATEGAKPGVEGGLNIEGIAWDPNNERLLLGLRSPQIGGQAVLIPIKLRDLRGPFKIENLKIDDIKVIILSLGGQGVRDITYDSHLKNFLIISGAPETEQRTDFGLWEWNGEPDSKPAKLMTLEGDKKPEGVTSVTINGRSYAFVVGDAGSYLRLDYR